MFRISLGLNALVLLSLGAVAFAGPSSLNPEDGKYKIKSLSAGKCLTVQGDMKFDGAYIVLNDCDGPSETLVWEVEGQDDGVKIRSPHSDLCILTWAPSNSDGARLIQSDCDHLIDFRNWEEAPRSVDQWRTFNLLQAQPNGFLIKSARLDVKVTQPGEGETIEVGKCFDVPVNIPDGATNRPNGSGIQQWKCHSQNGNQPFKFLTVE